MVGSRNCKRELWVKIEAESNFSLIQIQLARLDYDRRHSKLCLLRRRQSSQLNFLTETRNLPFRVIHRNKIPICLIVNLASLRVSRLAVCWERSNSTASKMIQNDPEPQMSRARILNTAASTATVIRAFFHSSLIDVKDARGSMPKPSAEKNEESGANGAKRRER